MLCHVFTQALQATQSLRPTASLPFEEQSSRSGGPVRSCEWKYGDGTVCEELIACASLLRHIREVHMGLRPPRRSSKRLQDPYLLQLSTFSLPVQSVSPKETLIHNCQWMKGDGTIYGAQIKGATVPQHLTTHGVKNMFSGSPLPCRWLGCRLRRDKYTVTRKSIVRHVRERHLGCKRPLSINQHYPSYGGYNTDWDQEVS